MRWMKNEELFLKAKAAKSEEALILIAKECGIDLTEESARAYFDQLHKNGELADEELENVSGGGCQHDGKLVVTHFHRCENWACPDCTYEAHGNYARHRCPRDPREGTNTNRFRTVCCVECRYFGYEDGLWVCERK